MDKYLVLENFLKPTDFEIGDYVEVLDTEEDSAWRFGRIIHINIKAQTAIIGYGSKNAPKDFLLYGTFTPEPLGHLKKVGE